MSTKTYIVMNASQKQVGPFFSAPSTAAEYARSCISQNPRGSYTVVQLGVMR